MLIFNHTSRSHNGSVAHTKWILVQLPKATLNFQSWTPGWIILQIIFQTCRSQCVFPDCVCLSSPRRRLLLSRKTSRIDRYGPIILGDNSVVPAWFNVKINIKFTLASVFAICGASFVPHPLLWAWHFHYYVVPKLCTEYIYSAPYFPRLFLIRWSLPPPSVYLASSLRQLPTGGFWFIMYIFDQVIIITCC